MRKQKQYVRGAVMNSRPDLQIDFCKSDAARYAVMNWHYSKRMPVFKTVKFGIWESGRFVGAVIFGCGGTPQIGSPYGLSQVEVCELVRVALTRHAAPVTKIVAVCIRKLKKTNPGLRLVVSFADTNQGHVGTIYQAGNWIYTGTLMHHIYVVKGVKTHPKTLHSRYGKGGQSIPWLRSNIDPKAERRKTIGKHKYLMPFDNDMRQQIEPLRKPYPKCVRSDTGDTPSVQDGKGGSIPTRTLSDE